MNQPDDDTVVFIVRLWQEPREIPGAFPELRGSIEHLASGTRQYFREIGSILSFITSYVDRINSESQEQP